MRRLLFACIPVLLVVGAVEVASYTYRTIYCPGDPPTYTVPNAEYGWNQPSGTVRTFSCAGTDFEWKNAVTFNSRGLNDSEVGYERVAGVQRILVLGDSVAEAIQVQREENFSEKLEAMFGEEGRRVEVINSGHSGFGTDNQVLFYEAEGHRYNPDVVLLEFNLQNDIAENSPTTVKRMYAHGPAHPKADVLLKGDGGIELDTADYRRNLDLWKNDPWRSWPTLAWLRRNSFFARHFAKLSRRDAATTGPADYPRELDVYAVPADADWTEARRISEALLQRLRKSVEQSGAQLIVAVVPSRETVEPEQWTGLLRWFPKLADGNWDLQMPRDWLIKFLEDEKFAVADTTDDLRRRQRETKSSAYFAFDPHPNANGHAWIAESIFPTLSRTLKEKS